MEKQVTVYSTPSCGYCHKAKEFFQAKGVEYKEIDVSQDHAAAQAMVEKSGQMGVPVIEIADSIVVGFNQPVIEELLNA